MDIIDKYTYWKKSLEQYYELEKVLKESDSKKIVQYKNLQNEKRIVVKEYIGENRFLECIKNIGHNNLVEILDVAFSNGKTFIIEEFVCGMTLTDRIIQGPIYKKEAKHYMLQVADGINALHKAGIIHRDIKPDNIKICESRTIKIIDYDIARIYKPYVNTDTEYLGTIGYAAPEQFGEGQTSIRTDIYAMGILLNVMITGAHPSVRRASGRIGKVVGKATMTSPNQRYLNAEEFAKAVMRI